MLVIPLTALQAALTLLTDAPQVTILHSTVIRGQVLLAALAAKDAQMETYAHAWRQWGQHNPRLPDPIDWMAFFSENMIYARASLGAVTPFREKSLSAVEAVFNPTTNLYTYHLTEIERLPDPIGVSVSRVFLWHYDLKRGRAIRLDPLPEEEIASYYDLCLQLERLEPTDATGMTALVEEHFISYTPYRRYRKGVLRYYQGKYFLLRDPNWRVAFQKHFPDFRVEFIPKDARLAPVQEAEVDFIPLYGQRLRKGETWDKRRNEQIGKTASEQGTDGE